jgi:tetratricopeptide (TPR) repeat protein
MYASRAICYKQMHQYKNALQDCNKALKLMPGETSLYRLRSFCYVGLGDDEKSLADLDYTVKMNPSVESHRMRGNARLDIHDYVGALEDFDYILTANPHDKEAKSKWDQARLNLGNSTKPRSSPL